MNSFDSVEYHFIATTPTTPFRLKIGYTDMNHEYDFVLCAYESEENKQKAMRLCAECDVLITGSAPAEYIRQRMLDKKLTFRYSERIYKKDWQLLQLPLRALKYGLRDHGNPNVYLLCASAYAAGDYAKTGFYKDKAYKWGYFPEVKRYGTFGELFGLKHPASIRGVAKPIGWKHPASILWVGRLIGWKHPPHAVMAAQRLKRENIPFKLDIIGSGELEGELRQMITDNGLEDCVHMLGAMPPEKVREHMEQSEIFLFTSDRNEGWGAVLNESMNSGCAVVASNAIGSVPFLIEDGKNGLIYQSGNVDDLTEKVKILIGNPDKRKELGEQAYLTMIEQWNAENAAKRLIELINAIMSGQDIPFADGVCSKA